MKKKPLEEKLILRKAMILTLISDLENKCIIRALFLGRFAGTFLEFAQGMAKVASEGSELVPTHPCKEPWQHGPRRSSRKA